MESEHELYVLLRKIRYDLTALQAKVTDAFAMLDALHLPLPDQGVRCPFPHCKLPMKGARSLELHIQNVHDGAPAPFSELELAELANEEPSNVSAEPVT
jgi:hypothetical protein